MKKNVIIVAGGRGNRMKSDLPKQFLCLAGIPVLIRTVRNFTEVYKNISIVVVLPEDYIEQWKTLCEKHSFSEPHIIVAGGEQRFNSVKNGLAQIQEEDCLIAVHDGVRPLVSKALIEKVFTVAEKKRTAIPFIPINDSLRIITETSSAPVDRNTIVAIQTPQCFNSGILKKAYTQEYSDKFTDDATVVENTGENIHLVEGCRENIKITTASDMLIAEEILRSV